MQVSEQFAKIVRRLLIIAFFVMAGLLVSARAQIAGTVGIQTTAIPVFSAQATSAHSAIFNDYGFAANYLQYCTSAFAGTVNLESQLPNETSYTQIALAKFPSSSPDTGCHTLQAGGYYPNLRSSVTRTAGTITAWYTASAAPIAYAASGLGTNGATAPIVCDHSVATTIAASANGLLTPGAPLATGDVFVICNATVSFNGAASAGTVDIFWDSSASCVSGVVTWESYTTANTPQYFPVPITQRSLNGSPFLYPCFGNLSGASAIVTISYASVQL